jgi:hypothetical protein
LNALTKVVREVWNCDGKISPWDIFPLFTETTRLPANCRVRWPPTDIKPSGTYNNVDVVLNSICSFDALRGNFNDGLRDNRGILRAERFEISISRRGSSAAYCKLLWNNPVCNFGAIGEFGPHIFLSILVKICLSICHECGRFEIRILPLAHSLAPLIH